jgi:hypothetical protein
MGRGRSDVGLDLGRVLLVCLVLLVSLVLLVGRVLVALRQVACCDVGELVAEQSETGRVGFAFARGEKNVLADSDRLRGQRAGELGGNFAAVHARLHGVDTNDRPKEPPRGLADGLRLILRPRRRRLVVVPVRPRPRGGHF